MYINYRPIYNNELMHYGILGMKWGVRRYQNVDGTLTDAGKKRYSKQQRKNADIIKRDLELEAKRKYAVNVFTRKPADNTKKLNGLDNSLKNHVSELKSARELIDRGYQTMHLMNEEFKKRPDFDKYINEAIKNMEKDGYIDNDPELCSGRVKRATPEPGEKGQYQPIKKGQSSRPERASVLESVDRALIFLCP